MSKAARFTLEWVSRKLLKAVHQIADELQENAKIKKETIQYMEQLNNLIDKILLLQGKPTVIKKDIKQVIKDDTEKPFDVNKVLETLKESDAK